MDKVCKRQPGGLQISPENIEQYLDNKREQIEEKIKSFLQGIDILDIEKLNISNVEYVSKRDFFNCGTDGYAEQKGNVPGSYCPTSKRIVICPENMSDYIHELTLLLAGKKLLLNHPTAQYLYCDLIFLHEYMHAYQHQIKGKELKNDASTDAEANRMAVVIFDTMYSEDDDIKKEVMRFYEKKSMFKFGDDCFLDKMFENKRNASFYQSLFN